MVLGCSGSVVTMELKVSHGAENTGFALHNSCTRLIDEEAAYHLRRPAILSAASTITQIAHLERSVIQ